MSDGIFPSRRTVDENGDDGMEEERRLAYVACTRAKNKLYLSYNNSYSFVLEENPQPSQFIREAGLNPFNEPAYKAERTPVYRGYSSSGFYADQSYDDVKQTSFDDDDKPAVNWEVGDIAIHEVFGRGVVTQVIDDTIIEVDFENHGKKSILASHPKIKKEPNGGLA